NPDAEYIMKNGSYIMKNYHFVPGYFNNTSPFIDNLRLLNHYGFCKTSAPELIDVHHLPKDNFGVMTFKINDTNGGEAKPYLDVMDTVPLEKKKNFLNEQFVLMDNLGKYNPAILESYDSWLVTPDSKNIYIDTWSVLDDYKSVSEKNKIKSELKSRLK
ncbi:MAG: hypothetical protein NC200_06280, partial [Candidatus Gastranaerophilales bacterium]|nr:hypothetical protein [Candidatus Gastranaerophilales bacterium]